MSWHSKWSTIKHRKWAQDAKKWKIFWKHARLLQIAAKWWSDPLANTALALAIENAKMENVPADNIERAIKKWSWEGKDAAQYEEVMYEGYLSGWVAVIVEALTDNKNRTVWNVRSIFSKSGGNLWESGSVNWMFKKRWEIIIDLTDKDAEKFEMEVIDSWAEDYLIEDSIANIYTLNNELGKVVNFFRKLWYEISSAKLSWIPNQKNTIESEEKANKLMIYLDLLEDDDDVTNVYTNADFLN